MDNKFKAGTLIISLFAASLSHAHNNASDHTPENRVIYEVFVRNFSPEGNLKGVTAQIPRLKELGVDVVWLMPIYKLGETGKWGSYSSPYAIKDYTKIDPDNGTEEDLRELVKAIHDNSMEIWFDWVGNHTSMDNVWTTTHPEFYSIKDGNYVHPFGGAWKDVYELNPDCEAMQDEMVRCMQYWVDNFDIDGFRCDYASGPSPKLWEKTSSRVLKNGKRITWLAEDSNKPSLVSNGYFDYNYCWDFQEKVLKKFSGTSDLESLRKACYDLANRGITEGESKEEIPQGVNPYFGRSRMVYLENHDVQQDQGGSADILYHKYLRPLTVLQFTVYGMPLLYNGQEIGYQTDGPVSLAEKTPIDWSRENKDMRQLIKTLIDIKHTQPVLNTGKESAKLINLHTSADDSVYAYRRSNKDGDIVVMLNFGDTERQFSVEGELPAGIFRDAFSGKTIDFTTGSSFNLPALGAAVFVRE